MHVKLMTGSYPPQGAVTGNARVEDCLEEHREDAGFSAECKEEFEAMMEARAADFRLDLSLREKCFEVIMNVCGYEKVRFLAALQCSTPGADQVCLLRHAACPLDRADIACYGKRLRTDRICCPPPMQHFLASADRAVNCKSLDFTDSSDLALLCRTPWTP